jgi:hypothetical protein
MKKPFSHLFGLKKREIREGLFLWPRKVTQTFWATLRLEAFKGFNLKLSSLTSFLT